MKQEASKKDDWIKRKTAVKELEKKRRETIVGKKQSMIR